MRSFHIVLISLMLIGFGAGASADSAHQQKFVDGAVDPQVFVEKASSGGAAEVELAKMALEKSTQDEVRHFAQMMIESHTVMNQHLRELAKNEGLNIADEPTLMKKAKAFVLSQKEGESFDESYAKNQVAAHERTYKLFREAANSPEENVREFAESQLETLEHHLNMARALATTVAQTRSAEKSPKGIYTP
jgi:putative membrane protein